MADPPFVERFKVSSCLFSQQLHSYKVYAISMISTLRSARVDLEAISALGPPVVPAEEIVGDLLSSAPPVPPYVSAWASGLNRRFGSVIRLVRTLVLGNATTDR
jgi:hypothetical protein